MKPIVVEKSERSTRVTIARPEKANALNDEVVEGLLEVVQASHTDGTRLLVIQSSAKNFSAGFDLTDVELASQGDLLRRFVRVEQLLQVLYHAPFGTLALARGRNFGAGADLFTACETRIASPDASFMFPGVRFGLQLGTRRLAHRTGETAARVILGQGRTLQAPEAVRIGLATEVLPEMGWEVAIAKAEESCGSLPPDALARIRAATVTDTRSADMADLVSSATAPDLKIRLLDYVRRR